MLRSIQGIPQKLRGAPARALHTTPAANAKRRNTRKAELEAKRKAEIEASLRAEEQLRKLKDTQFLNSLVKPDRLFETTQISQQDAAISSSMAFQGKGDGKEGVQRFDEGLKRQANSGLYSCHVRPEEVRMVTEVAPKAVVGADTGYSFHVMPEAAAKSAEIQADIVRRIVALENANSKAVVNYNIQKALETFGRSEGDSGSAEVQAAVWTVRINNLEDHLRSHRKDHHNRRAYTHLLHKRAKILKYLKRESLERYYVCLKQLGLTKEMVEGEIVPPKRIE
ncbi:S15/NS1 RNA-binding domain-containing protein [Martensiomyces pterosporus]|nr:S15/NS1 RNA-binding domain-containing protein [Martensiomyces pterosporus]